MRSLDPLVVLVGREENRVRSVAVPVVGARRGGSASVGVSVGHGSASLAPRAGTVRVRRLVVDRDLDERAAVGHRLDVLVLPGVTS